MSRFAQLDVPPHTALIPLLDLPDESHTEVSLVGEVGLEPTTSASRTPRASQAALLPDWYKKPLLRVPCGWPGAAVEGTHLDTPGYVISRRATKAIDGMATLCSGHCPSSPVDCHSRLRVRYNTGNSSKKDGRGTKI